MDGDAINAIQGSVQTIVFERPDDFDQSKSVSLFTKPVHRMPVPIEPRADTLIVHSLQGVIDYVTSDGVDDNDPEKKDTLHIHVVGYDSVKVISDLKGVNRKREEFVHAVCEGSSFRFGVYLDVEEMVIALQTLFAPVDDRTMPNDQTSLLKLFSSLTNEAVRTDGDDGLTQVVSTRKGISLAQDCKVPNPVYLRPWRTFREVTQPGSPFILRLKSQGTDKPPQAALFEADGGSWKLDAIQRIKTFLTESIDEKALILG